MAAGDTSEDAIDRWQKANRLSLRCVLVTGGADPGPALAAAGIFDPIAIPVVLGDEPNLPRGILGNGRTPNLVGTLEFDQPGAFNAPPGAQLHPAQSAVDDAPPSGPVTTTAPAAFGTRSFAPIRRSGYRGQRLHAEAEPYKDRAEVYSPSRSWLVQADSKGIAQGTKLSSYSGDDLLNSTDLNGLSAGSLGGDTTASNQSIPAATTPTPINPAQAARASGNVQLALNTSRIVSNTNHTDSNVQRVASADDPQGLKMASAAARAGGLRTPEELEIFHDAISRRNITKSRDIVDIAEQIKKTGSY